MSKLCNISYIVELHSPSFQSKIDRLFEDNQKYLQHRSRSTTPSKLREHGVPAPNLVSCIEPVTRSRIKTRATRLTLSRLAFRGLTLIVIIAYRRSSQLLLCYRSIFSYYGFAARFPRRECGSREIKDREIAPSIHRIA